MKVTSNGKYFHVLVGDEVTPSAIIQDEDHFTSSLEVAKTRNLLMIVVPIEHSAVFKQDIYASLSNICGISAPRHRTEAEAMKLVQSNLVKIKELMDQSAKIMDTHQFSVSFLGLDYIPNGMTSDDSGLHGDMFHMNNDDYKRYFAGKWMSSSEYKEC